MKTLIAIIASGFIFTAVLQASPSLDTMSACTSIAAPTEQCRK